MRWTRAGTLLALVLLTGTTLMSMGAVPSPPMPARIVPPDWQFVLPEGDAKAGDLVFRKLQCWSCHRVAGRSFEEAGDEDGQVGPRLTSAHAGLPREYIAHRLISYDRFFAEGFYKATWSRSDGSSRMGNYNETMTVRDLIDLVAFIKSIERESRPTRQ